MKRTCKLLACMAMLPLLIAGCTDELDFSVTKTGHKKRITIRVSMPEEATTRVAYDDGKVGSPEQDALTWQENDTIAVVGMDGYDPKGIEYFSLTAGAGTTYGQFTGNVPESDGSYKIYHFGNKMELDEWSGSPVTNMSGQIQNGNNSTAHLRNYILLQNEEVDDLTQPLALEMGSAVMKFELTDIPADMGALTRLIWTVETAAGMVSHSLGFEQGSVVFNETNRTLTAYLSFLTNENEDELAIKAGGEFRVWLMGDRMYAATAVSQNGKTYEAGKRYTAALSVWEQATATPHIEATDSLEYLYYGDFKEFGLASYMEVTIGGGEPRRVPLPWTVDFSTDNGNSWSAEPPEWLFWSVKKSQGSIDTMFYWVDVAMQFGVGGYGENNPHTNALRAAAAVSNYNLSNSNGGSSVENTANCYLVNAPGSYRLPLVYGNAVKNGATNSAAYIASVSGNDVLQHFVNHLNNNITDPYIYNNAGCTPANCTLVWQDGEDLVTDVRLSSDGHFLEFDVDGASIRQGNAIVAVRDASNNIMWSWHIWVTDYELGTDLKSITNSAGNAFTILPVNLGWCDRGPMVYAGRVVHVRFNQAIVPGQAVPANAILRITQKGHSVPNVGHNPFFQHGRKDPMLPAAPGDVPSVSGLIGKDITHYTIDDNYRFRYEGVGVNIATAIKNPHKFYNDETKNNWNDWCSVKYSNLWNMKNTLLYNTGSLYFEDPVEKTVYDPSPVGYSLPPAAAFNGLTPVSGSSFDSGRHFYCGENQTGETVFFPASGERLGSSGSAMYMEFGTSYASWAHVKGSKMLSPFSTNMYTAFRSSGLSLRPACE